MWFNDYALCREPVFPYIIVCEYYYISYIYVVCDAYDVNILWLNKSVSMSAA